MNKKIIVAIVVILFLIVAVSSVRFFSGNEDTWICLDGVWIKQGSPTSEAPTTACGPKKDELKVDSVKVYFSSSKMDPEMTCQKVFPVERKIIASKELYYEAALTELLNGPSDADRAQGYETAINQNVSIQKVKFEEGVLTVDFDKQMEFEMGGSCRVGLIRLQIEETLKQFPEVKQVIISIDGRTEDILQP